MLKPKKTHNVDLGTAYDINKNLVEKYEKPIAEEDFADKYSMFEDHILKNDDTYYMLLCNEEKDYTIFRQVEPDETVVSIIFNELKECLYNRGSVYGFDITEDKMAIEIWLKKENGMHCYYFFKYGEGVIEC